MSGFSKRGLQRLHDVMTGYVERGEVPGLVTHCAKLTVFLYLDRFGGCNEYLLDLGIAVSA